MANKAKLLIIADEKGMRAEIEGQCLQGTQGGMRQRESDAETTSGSGKNFEREYRCISERTGKEKERA